MDSETSTNQRASLFGLPRTAVVCKVVLFLTLATAILFGFKSLMDARSRAQGKFQFEIVIQGLRNYRSACYRFPPAAVLNEHGQPMHSWRTLLVPYTESNWFDNYYDYGEPWNGPSNQRLLQEYVAKPDYVDEEDDKAYDITSHRWWYQCGSCIQGAREDFHTKLVMVVDPNQSTVPVSESFPRSKPSSKVDNRWQTRLPMGEDLMIVAIQESDIHWLEPRDLSPDELISQINNPSQPTNSCLRAFRSVVMKQDETVQFLNEGETLERLQQMQSKIEQNSDPNDNKTFHDRQDAYPTT